ncbi:hypothetical protein SO802_001068 [Lithocarpus litseifolius]|uniref:Uncharacterized protein n=1 Tax=Lithocarpus litseifolius TaxID=425828 RepID=A0AAW2DV23_9ROSI
MSSASSNQSFVRDGAGYDEVRLSGPRDPYTSSEDNSSTSSSSSSRDEDRMESNLSDGLGESEPPPQSVIGPDGMRKFVMLSLWMVNDFTSSIKESHFKTLREKYQIPVNIPLRLPFRLEKCYYDGVMGVGIYEQMLKAGLRFPLSSLHRQLLQHLGLFVTQVSPNAWRVFIGVEVLYGVMFKGKKRLTVEEFFHCYRPVEITKSKGMYSFVAKSPLLRLVSDTPDSNRDWKSRYIFMDDNEWMCHPGNTQFMPVDTTWGILPLSGMHPFIFVFNLYISSMCFFNRLLLAAQNRPQISLEDWSFLENFFQKTKLEERSWVKLVRLETINWYCDGPEPSEVALKYEKKVRARKFF